MSRGRFTIFDLVYFTGEWLDEHYHSLRGVDGVGLVFLGWMFVPVILILLIREVYGKQF